MTLKLNNQQRLAYNSIISPITTIITGSAGTGKTFVLSATVKELLSRDKKVLICSPTHQSLKVIKKAVNLSHVNLTFKTVASVLVKFPWMDSNSGDTYFSRGKLSKVLQQSDYIFVDEISSVSERDFSLICGLSHIKNINLFGDFAQLLPVKQKQIKLSNLTVKYSHINLTEQMRNTSDIESLAEENREKISLPRQSTKNIKLLKSEDKLLEIFLKNLEKSDNPLSMCYLAFTNKVVEKISSQISLQKFPYLRLNSNYNKFAKNGDILQVIKNPEEIIRDNDFGFEYKILEVKHLETETFFSLHYVDNSNFEILTQRREKLKSLLAHIKDAKYSKIILDQIKYLDSFPTFSSPFVLTVHKSQGSTYQEVYINSHDILKSTNKKRLMYVAISRAKEKLYMSH
jgi:exodeoxyribonuclease-5